MIWKSRPKLKFEDLNIKVATDKEIDNIRIKSYKYINMGKTGVCQIEAGKIGV